LKNAMRMHLDGPAAKKELRPAAMRVTVLPRRLHPMILVHRSRKMGNIEMETK
jgi:hypothetical protein